MASAENNAPALPQQPALRPFIVFEELPAGHISFPVTDHRLLPHLRPGDVAVVDLSDHDPMHHEIFLIEWSTGARALVSTWLESFHFSGGANGETRDGLGWMVGGINRPIGKEETLAWAAAGRGGIFVDGPYATEGANAGVLADKLVGRVVGLLEAAFEEPKRVSAVA